jgi:hypothetical protein
MIPPDSHLWQYLSASQRALAADGTFLVTDTVHYRDSGPSDYSYLVFPFAKLYEGFLKKFFLDLGIITEKEYRSDHYRIGKTLSPHLISRLKHRSAYGQVEKQFGADLATQLWYTWKNGRNLVFHYFPHNYRALTLTEAKSVITLIINTMNRAVEETQIVTRITPHN